MSRLKPFLFSLALTVSIPLSASAGGFALTEQSTVAGGTAGAGAARADDASAAWYNPAALADDGGLRIGIGVLGALSSLSAESMDGAWSENTDNKIKTPPHLYVSHASGNVAYGLSLGVPFGAGVSWPDDWQGRHEVLSTSLQVFRIAPFVGYSFGRIRVAAGPHFDAGSLHVVRGLDFIDSEGNVELLLSGTGIGAHASVFFQPTPELDVGLTYKSRTKIKMSGDADFTAPDAFSQKTVDQQAKTQMTMPDRFVLGGRYTVGPWSVLGDLELTMWGVNQEQVIEFENEMTPDAVQSNGWKPTLSVRAGTEYAVHKAWVLRGGAFYDPSPAQDENLAPSSPDSNRVGATAGLSRAITDTVSVDAFYEYMHILARTADNANSLAARYSGRAQIFGLGLRFEQ